MPASPHDAIIDAVRAKLITLAATADGLDGITAARIVKAWLPSVEKLQEFEKLNGLPAVFVCPWGVETIGGGTNADDDYTFPVPVSIVAAADPDLTNHIPKWLQWRWTAITAFQNKNLDGAGGTYKCTVTPNPIVNIPALTQHGYWSTTFQVNATIRAARPA